MKAIFLLSFTLSSATLFAQQFFYDVAPGTGNGLRFWQNDDYKIHMGNTAEYHYGPVTDYSIKMNMSNTVGRGWTWGIVGLTPIAGLNTDGNMQIAGNFTISGNSNPINFTSAWSSSPNLTNNVAEISNDVGTYQQLMIVGNKSQGADRRVGIWDRLSIDGAGFSQTLNVNGGSYFAGNVGIGTTSPSNTQGWSKVLDVRGGAHSKIIATADDATYRTGIYSHSTWFGGGGLVGTESNHNLHLIANSDPKVTITVSGNVGVGTKTPNEKLTVNGTIYGKEVRVDLSVPGPDYVFETDYALTPLDEIETYINVNKRLPEVPSAREMEANGIKVGQMNMLLLKKVEELTLYVIELKKENAQLRDEFDQKLEALKKLISESNN